MPFPCLLWAHLWEWSCKMVHFKFSFLLSFYCLFIFWAITCLYEIGWNYSLKKEKRILLGAKNTNIVCISKFSNILSFMYMLFECMLIIFSMFILSCNLIIKAISRHMSLIVCSVNKWEAELSLIINIGCCSCFLPTLAFLQGYRWFG